MPKKVLLLDNNREYRHTMASIVRRIGYDVIQAEGIAEAIERLASDRPDLVMMADDVEVVAWLKTNQFPVRTPIVVYTAQTGRRIDEALLNGAAALQPSPSFPPTWKTCCVNICILPELDRDPYHRPVL